MTNTKLAVSREVRNHFSHLKAYRSCRFNVRKVWKLRKRALIEVAYSFIGDQTWRRSVLIVSNKRLDCPATNENTRTFCKHDVSPRNRNCLTGVGHGQYITMQTRKNIRENVKSYEFLHFFDYILMKSVNSLWCSYRRAVTNACYQSWGWIVWVDVRLIWGAECEYVCTAIGVLIYMSHTPIGW